MPGDNILSTRKLSITLSYDFYTPIFRRYNTSESSPQITQIVVFTGSPENVGIGAKN